jgi:hypothetical protein
VIKQFYGESLFISFIALGFALLLVLLLLPYFNQLSGKDLTFPIFSDFSLVIGLFGIGMITGLISGSYPSFYLSRFQPVTILKQMSGKGLKGILFRRILVVFQFVLSIFLIVSSLVIVRQLHYMKNKDLGFQPELFAYTAPGNQIINRFEIVREELDQHPNIENVAMSSSLPGYINPGTNHVDWEGKTPDIDVVMHDFPVGYDFIEIMGMSILEGRSFSRIFATDSSGYILNETAVRSMNLQGGSPLGKRFSFEGREGIIIGVVKDFHHGSLHEPVEPLVLHLRDGFILCLRFKSGDLSETIPFLKNKWVEWESVYPFEIEYLIDRYNDFYQNEDRLSSLINTATILAILISCLGLFGLASFLVEQRIKEIGIRKVLGASIGEVVILLSREFMKWIILANIIAWPLAWFIMKQWLQNFAYRTNLSLWVFGLAAAGTLFLSMFTVCWQTFRAALADPVESLRYE